MEIKKGNLEIRERKHTTQRQHSRTEFFQVGTMSIKYDVKGQSRGREALGLMNRQRHYLTNSDKEKGRKRSNRCIKIA